MSPLSLSTDVLPARDPDTGRAPRPSVAGVYEGAAVVADALVHEGNLAEGTRVLPAARDAGCK